MKARKRSLVSWAFCLVSVFALGLVMANAAMAGEALKVTIGGSSWKAEDAHGSDLSLEALKSGQRDFVVSASADQSFDISLSDQQAEDILAGSTVVVDTAEGDQKVTIGPMKKKASKSGW